MVGGRPEEARWASHGAAKGSYVSLRAEPCHSVPFSLPPSDVLCGCGGFRSIRLIGSQQTSQRFSFLLCFALYSIFSDQPYGADASGILRPFLLGDKKIHS